MQINQFDIWIADLNSRLRTEAGKIRPVLILQTDLLNKFDHPSTIICPITTNVRKDIEILRVGIPINEESGLKQNSDVLVDQIRAIDNERLTAKIGSLPTALIPKIKENLSILLDLD